MTAIIVFAQEQVQLTINRMTGTMAHRLFMMTSLLLLLTSVQAQSKKKLMAQHKMAKAELAASRSTWSSIEDLCAEYKQLDELPRLLWGKVPLVEVGRCSLQLGQKTFQLLLYDLDGDKVADEFALNDDKGQPLREEFGFLYDADGNGMIDRVIYYAGPMMDTKGNLKYLFHHWADLNADGRVDAITNPFVVFGNDSLPDFNRVLLVRDTDGDNKVNTVEALDLSEVAMISLEAKDGAWTFRSVFGEDSIGVLDEDVFQFYNTILQAILSNAGRPDPPSP